MQGVVPHPEIAPVLRSHFVALASDCDDPEPEVEALAMHLEDATMLPFMMFTDAEGNYLGGGHGAVDPARFEQALEQLVAEAGKG